MENIQFYHNKEEGYTAAVQVDFTREDLEEMALVRPKLYLMVGLAYTHPEDNYCKEIGRKVSKERLSELKVKLKQIIVEDENRIQYIYEDNGHELTFRTSRLSSKPHLIKVNFKEYNLFDYF